MTSIWTWAITIGSITIRAIKPNATTLVGAALLLALPACPPQAGTRAPATEGGDAGAGPPARRKDRGEVVATIGRDRITVGMLEDELNRQNPYVRMRFVSDERKKDFLQNMVRFEVLAREAKRRKLDSDPEVVRRVKRVMIDRMMEQLRGSLVRLEQVTDQDVRDYYEKNKQLYQQPPKVRASVIVTRTRQEALAALNKARQKPTDVSHFAELVQQYSIDATSKEQRGDLSFFSRGDTKIPAEIVEAAFSIESLWALGGPFKTAGGWAVLIKTGEVAAINRPLELEQNRIKNRIFNERRLEAVEKYVAELQARATVKILDKNLAKVKPDLDPRPSFARPDHVH